MRINWSKYLPKFISDKLKNHLDLQPIIGNSAWLLIDKILRMGVGILIGAWVARYLGPENFGLLNYALSFTMIFGAIASVGIDGILIRELVKNPELKNNLLGSAFTLKIIGSFSAFSISLITVYLLQSEQPIIIFLVGISSATFIFQTVNVIDCYFQANLLSKNTVFSASAAFILISLTKVLLILSSAPLIMFAWANFGEIILTSGFLLLAYKLNHHKIKEWQFEINLTYKLFKESLPMILSALAVTLYMRLDVLMLKEMANESDVGLYAAATRISEILYVLPGILVASYSPTLIRAHKNSNREYLEKLNTLYFSLTWISIGFATLIFCYSDEIIKLLFGSRYIESGSILAIHLWSSIAVSLGIASSQYLLIENFLDVAFYRTLIGLFSNILLNLLLIPIMGAKGAAISTVISYFLATYSMIFFKNTRDHAFFLIKSSFKST